MFVVRPIGRIARFIPLLEAGELDLDSGVVETNFLLDATFRVAFFEHLDLEAGTE